MVYYVQYNASSSKNPCLQRGASSPESVKNHACYQRLMNTSFSLGMAPVNAVGWDAIVVMSWFGDVVTLVFVLVFRNEAYANESVA
jgi:hypothetical protein